MSSERDFGSDVLLTAWMNSRTLLSSRFRAIVLATASLAIGAVLQWLVSGFSENLLSDSRVILYSVATAIVVFAIRFLWQLFLAPSEIIHAEIRPVLEYGSAFGVPRLPNYSLWKRRRSFSVNELSALLVGTDPSASATTDFRTMTQLVLEGLRVGDLKGSDPFGNARQVGQLPDIGTLIAKQDAIDWAESHGFTERVAQLL